MRVIIFSQVAIDNTRENGLKLHHEKFRLDIIPLIVLD